MPDEPERPKRLSLSHILELMLTRGPAGGSHVAISRNPKGETLIDVTVRTGDEFATLAEAELAARDTYARLRAEYPSSNGQYAGSSVDYTRNAKGETQIAVSVKTGDDADADAVEVADVLAQKLYDQARAKYPLASGYVGASVESEKGAKGAKGDAGP